MSADKVYLVSDRVYLYDTTLRDGAQTRGIDFTLADRQAIARELDKLGIDYIEGGWPGSNPNDDAFFAAIPALKTAKLSAFGMTRKSGRSADNDPGLAALLESGAKTICVVGKSWDKQVKSALAITEKENIRMIGESVAHIVKHKREAIYDAEHFFDGYKSNPDFALACLKAAYDNGARWIVLCDTNGGSLPFDVESIVGRVAKHIPGTHLGIHCHNDTGNAIANSLSAVRAGARQVQGTINGIGERCGNADLITLIPNLMLKMGLSTGVSKENLARLVQVSRFLDERVGRIPDEHVPYVGASAFAHKGGLHASAMAKDNTSYEHIDPALVGNERTILVSDKAGKSNILDRLQQFGIDLKANDERVSQLVHEVKTRETMGYAYEGAEASFELLARRMMGSVPNYFEVLRFRVIGERRYNAKGKIINVTEATIKLKVGDDEIMTVAEGNGPVNALDKALRKGLSSQYKSLSGIRLTDFKVRILDSAAGTEAVTRVVIESCDSKVGKDKKGHTWSTLGVSTNLMDAAFEALIDSLTYRLLHTKANG